MYLSLKNGLAFFLFIFMLLLEHKLDSLHAISLSLSFSFLYVVFMYFYYIVDVMLSGDFFSSFKYKKTHIRRKKEGIV